MITSTCALCGKEIYKLRKSSDWAHTSGPKIHKAIDVLPMPVIAKPPKPKRQRKPGTKIITVRLADELHNQVRESCRDRESINKFCIAAIAREIERRSR